MVDKVVIDVLLCIKFFNEHILYILCEAECYCLQPGPRSSN